LEPLLSSLAPCASRLEQARTPFPRVGFLLCCMLRARAPDQPVEKEQQCFRRPLLASFNYRLVGAIVENSRVVDSCPGLLVVFSVSAAP
jgi:hypothetical protein